jgi:hypothetical protein
MRYPLVPGPRPPGAARGASYGDARPGRRRPMRLVGRVAKLVVHVQGIIFLMNQQLCLHAAS